MKPTRRHFDHFNNLALGFTTGLGRVAAAQAVNLVSTIAQLKIRMGRAGRENERLPGEGASPPLALDGGLLELAEYVNNASHLIYATALFDTFLSDVTRFLFLLFPGALGKEQQVKLELVLTSRSKSAIVNGIVARRVRELSYASFGDRLELLRSRFGVGVDLDAASRRELERVASLRNRLVHDEGPFEVFLSSRGALSTQIAKNPKRPTSIADNEVEVAIDLYGEVFYAIYLAVTTKIFCTRPHEIVEAFRATLPKNVRGRAQTDAKN
jgi:hypothetical protein